MSSSGFIMSFVATESTTLYPIKSDLFITKPDIPVNISLN